MRQDVTVYLVLSQSTMLIQDNMIGAIAYKTSVVCPAFDGWLPVSISIAATTHTTYAGFNLFGTTYTFTITKWSGRGFTPFLQKFHDHTPRDEAQFGKLVTNAEGQPFPNLDMEQKWNCLVQVRSYLFTVGLLCSCDRLIGTVAMQPVMDIMKHLDQIFQQNKRVVLDYAVWYRESKHKETDTYAQFIQLVTCHCIVHSDFLAPGVTYDVVPFV